MIPVYVINLKRSPERRAFMEGVLAGAGIDGAFVAAADGRRFPALCGIEAGGLSREEVALVISHRRAWRRLLQSGAPLALVLEDDVHLGADARAFLDLDFSGFDFDVVKLETWTSKTWISRAGRPAAGRKLHRLGYEHFGAAAYLIRREAAARLLRATRRIVEPVDVTLFGGRALFSGEVKALQLVPALAIQDCSHPAAADRRNLASTLHADRARLKAVSKANKPRGWPRVRREVLRVTGQVWRVLTLSPTMRRAAIPWR